MNFSIWIVWKGTNWSFNCVDKKLMFNWIVRDILQYLQPFNFVDIVNRIVKNRQFFSLGNINNSIIKVTIHRHGILLYSHMQIHAGCILTRWIKTSEDFFKKNIPLTLFDKVCVWEGVRDRTELQHIDPHSYGHQRCVFLVLQGCSAGGVGAHSAGFWLPLLHLVTDFLPSPSYIIVQSPTQYLWNGMFDRHQAEKNCHAVHRSLSSGASHYDCTLGF